MMSRRGADPQRVASAQLTGIAARYALRHVVTAKEALGEIREVLTKWSAHGRQTVLDQAAASYVRPSSPGDEYWHPAALQLLLDAGADGERAKAIWAARPSARGLAGLGEGGGGKAPSPPAADHPRTSRSSASQ